MQDTKKPDERAILVGVAFQKGKPTSRDTSLTPEESLDELAELAFGAGALVQERILQNRPGPEAATLIGSGKVQEIAALVLSTTSTLVIFDQELSPTQQRNLEKALDARVIDRTQLILDIFALRARTREGRLQVELAQLSYILPRLTGRGIEMSKQGGGIGTRGPGETQLETDRRRIGRRIKKLKEDLEAVRSARAVHRKQRTSIPLPTVALAGYTNAGKSTLFNRLTEAAVLADAKMFATLDPTVRAVTLPSRRRVLLSDTVGFIRNLPTTLVKAFRATLEEVTEAALILHVVDISAPHAVAHTQHVLKVLDEIEASAIPQLLILNKMDRLGAEPLDCEAARHRLTGEQDSTWPSKAVGISALSGAGMSELLAVVDQALPFDPLSMASFRFPMVEGASVSLLHQLGRVIETAYDESGCRIVAEVPESVRERLKQYLEVTH